MNPSAASHPIDHSYREFYHLLEKNLEVGAKDNFSLIDLRYQKMKQLHPHFQVEGLDELLRLYRLFDFGDRYMSLIKQVIGAAQSYLSHLEQLMPRHY